MIQLSQFSQFLQGPSESVYNRVFLPLSQALGDIKASKHYYGAPPFVKIRTVCETATDKVQIFCNIINANSLLTPANRAFAFMRDGAGSVVNIFCSQVISSDVAWKCSSLKTAEALDTAITTLSDRIREEELRISKIHNLDYLPKLLLELSPIAKTLEAASKTVYYVYRTYHQKPSAGEEAEQICNSDAQEAIAIKYKALLELTKRFAHLQESINTQLNPAQPCSAEASLLEKKESGSYRDIPREEQELKTSESDQTPPSSQDTEQPQKTPSGRKLPPIPKDQGRGNTGSFVPLCAEIVFTPNEGTPTERETSPNPNTFSGKIRAMADPSLKFKTQEDAGKWFCTRLTACRKDGPKATGIDAYADLQRNTQIVKQPPKPWVLFGKGIDAAFIDPLDRYQFIQDFYKRFTDILKTNDLKIEEITPNSFNAILKGLCKAGVPRSVYQAFFLALLNEGRTPQDLQCAHVLNIIMNNHAYFPIFDPEHTI